VAEWHCALPTSRCDGPLLEALRRGAWVLLDELNLASQSVLEGLNAVLDHREEVRVSCAASVQHSPQSEAHEGRSRQITASTGITPDAYTEPTCNSWRLKNSMPFVTHVLPTLVPLPPLTWHLRCKHMDDKLGV
jgi:AAA domain (dynein-related subfamily)